MQDDHRQESAALPASGRRFSVLPRSVTSLPPPQAVAGDLLHGAEEIAVFLFGDGKHRRRVYNLVDGNELPVFRIGANICARKSVLMDWIARQERGNSSAGGVCE